MLTQPFRALSVEAYVALVQNLPLPTSRQRRNFVDYVACAHSWYKHLPLFLPGDPFYFYIDRSAGCDWVRQQDGSYVIAERQKQGFHYSDIPTAEYRTRFGYLSYSCSSGTAVFAGGEALTLPRDKVVAIPGEDARPRYLPEAVLNTGRVELTAVIHPYFAVLPWRASLPSDASRIYWPTESGGERTLKRILKRLAKMGTPEYESESRERVARWSKEREACPTSKDGIELSRESMWGEDPSQDPVLRELLKPERRRQETEMLKAIDRICVLIQAPGP
jgi:hypothetical protein